MQHTKVSNPKNEIKIYRQEPEFCLPFDPKSAWFGLKKNLPAREKEPAQVIIPPAVNLHIGP
jgi:hypothetical protein